MFIKGMKAALALVNNLDDHRRLSLYIETLEKNQTLYLERHKPGVTDKIAEEFAEKMLTGMTDLATIAHQEATRKELTMPHSSMTLKELIRCAQDSDDTLVKALVSTLDELTDEIGILAIADKEKSSGGLSSFEEQFEYIKRLLGFENNY